MQQSKKHLLFLEKIFFLIMEVDLDIQYVTCTSNTVLKNKEKGLTLFVTMFNP